MRFCLITALTFIAIGAEAQVVGHVEKASKVATPVFFQDLKAVDNSKIGFLLKTDQKVKVDVLSKPANPELFTPAANFEDIRQKYSRDGHKVLYIVTGAYIDRNSKIEGVYVDHGVPVGDEKLFAKHTALVKVSDGKFSLHSLADMDAKKIQETFEKAKQEKSSLFQQHLAINNGVASETRFNKAKLEEDFRYKMRFLVEFENGESGIVQFDNKNTWAESMKELKKLKVKNATYLDMGALAAGVLFDDNGSGVMTGIDKATALQDFKVPPKIYTNLLVFYTD